MAKIRLLLAVKGEIIYEGLAKILAGELNIEVVRVCRTGLEAIEGASEHQPDVVLIDTDLSENSTIEALWYIHQRLPKTVIIVLSHSETIDDFYSAAAAGARGYISEDIEVESLIRAIFLAVDGEVIISPVIASRVLAELGSLKKHRDAVNLGDASLLSKRERAVLSLVAQGFTNREIATTLFISEHTSKVHLRNIMQKVHAHNRQQAVALVRREGLLSRVSETDIK